MRTQEEKNQILSLSADGFNPSQISRILLIPRGTVRDIVKRGDYKKPKADVAQLAEALGSEPSRWRFESSHRYSYYYLLGMYLGDGYINREPRCEKLRIFCDAKYPGIINEVVESIKCISRGRSVKTIRRQNCITVYCYLSNWSSILPQHGKGRKHNRRIRLLEWQKKDIHDKALIRGLIHSDGCRFKNITHGYEYHRYMFANLSNDIHDIFRSSCKRLGIGYTTSQNKTYVTKRKYVSLMDDFVGEKS